MEKTLVSVDELVTILNNELSKNKDYNDCRFTSLLSLAGVDEDGCNWSTPRIRCSGMHAEVCEPIANKIFQEARKKYNLK